MESVDTIIRKIIKDKPECKNDEMQLFYEYTRYLGLPILQFPKIFYDNKFRKEKNIREFSTVSRALRDIK